MKAAAAAGLTAAAAWALSGCAPARREEPAPSAGPAYRMPAEGGAHERTWMAYGATVGTWGEDAGSALGRDLGNSRHVARQDLIRIAAALSRFEPVTMLVDSAEDEAEARGYLADAIAALAVKDQLSATLDGSGRIHVGQAAPANALPPIETFPVSLLRRPLDDLWARDTAPVFVLDPAGRQHGVNLNFNGWGQWPLSTGLPRWRKDRDKTANGVIDQPVERDRTVAASIAAAAGVPTVSTWLTMEGGGIEVNGSGLGIAMASSIINPNRNPGKSKTEIEAELRRLFGIEHVMWMPGVMGEELTDWHVDFSVRFATADTLLFAFDEEAEPADRRNEKAMRREIAAVNALPAEQRSRLLGGGATGLTAHALPTPDVATVYGAVRERNTERPITTRGLDEFAWTAAPGYIGYYEGNGCIVLGQFGDLDADREAFAAVQAVFPNRVVMQLSTDGLMNTGGTIHCATQQQPRR